MWLHVEFTLNIWQLSGYMFGYMSSVSEKKNWGLKCLIPFKGQYNKNGKGNIYTHSLSLASFFSPPPPPSFKVSTNVNITTTLKGIAHTSLKWVEININFYFLFCHNTFFLSKTLALESTFNICIHHFQFHTFGENHFCPHGEHVNTDIITLK